MVTDPNIILAGNQMAQPRLPDVNAMMQTRTAGLENIYEIEAGRQEQAAQAEQEAAKAQEDATFKALLPAYTYGIQTGDIAGAGNLVPPELRPQLQQYIDALAGRSPQEVQAALIGSLSSDPRGQEALSAIQRGQTFGVQSRQQDLAEKRYAAELAAAGQPEPMSAFEEVQSGFREREVALKEEEAKAKATLPEGMDVKTKAKLDQAYPQASKALKTTVTALDQDIADVKALLKDRKGLAAITGTFNAMTPDIMRDATRAAARYDKITAGAGFTALSDLKAASPTGGALGNVSNDEGRRLRDSVATFSRKQNTQDFADGLERYLVDLEMSRENVLSAYDETYSYREDAGAASIAEDLQKQRSRIEQETLTPKLPPAPSGVKVIRKN
jgi:hypothetical protein